VPPLRERAADIPALIRHFLARFAAEEGKRIRLVSPEALRILSAFHWPGNIRQLENAVFRAVVLAEGDSVGLDEFPQIAAQAHGQAGNQCANNVSDAVADADTSGPAGSTDEYESALIPIAFDEAPSPAAYMPPLAPSDALPLLDAEGEVRPLDEIESELIRYAITHYRGQMSEVARRLRIGRSTLYRKLEALGLNHERPETDTEAVAAERQPGKFP
jgi:DNA-binding NtrC family response regulator